jgi:hypothetical protein
MLPDCNPMPKQDSRLDDCGWNSRGLGFGRLDNLQGGQEMKPLGIGLILSGVFLLAYGMGALPFAINPMFQAWSFALGSSGHSAELSRGVTWIGGESLNTCRFFAYKVNYVRVNGLDVAWTYETPSNANAYATCPSGAKAVSVCYNQANQGISKVTVMSKDLSDITQNSEISTSVSYTPTNTAITVPEESCDDAWVDTFQGSLNYSPGTGGDGTASSGINPLALVAGIACLGIGITKV